MEKGSSEILVEALSKSRFDLLQEKETRIAGGKGKAKVTEQDEEEEVKFRRKLEDIDATLLDIKNGHQDSTKISKLPKLDLFVDEDEGLVWNPFTSSFAYRETKFEPGPSCLKDNQKKYHKAFTLSTKSQVPSA